MGVFPVMPADPYIISGVTRASSRVYCRHCELLQAFNLPAATTTGRGEAIATESTRNAAIAEHADVSLPR